MSLSDVFSRISDKTGFLTSVSNNNSPYNEVNRSQRLQAEKNPNWEIFFNKSGNPFLGFMRFLRRVPVQKEPIDEKRLLKDYSSIASDEIKKGISILIIVILVFIFCFLDKFNAVPRSVIFISDLMFLGAFIFCIYYFKRKNKKSGRRYTLEDYKNYVIESAISDKVEDLVYEPYCGLPRGVYNSVHITKDGDYYDSKDLITAKYHNIYFVQSNLKIENQGNNQSYVYFYGKWIVIDYPKKFSGTVTIMDKNYPYGVKKDKESEKIELENPDFNNMFNIRADNSELAYYLLTPQLMEKLIVIKQNLKGKLALCFKDGYLHIGINDGVNSFVPDYSAKSLHSDIAKFQAEFSLIAGLIETLEIDNSVYTQ